MPDSHETLVEITAKVVAAFVGNNRVPGSELPIVIDTVFKGFRDIGKPIEAPAQPQSPAISVRKSVTPEYIICLEDGKKLKMLKRHLRTTYDMTPEEYRAKWGLPPDYPMVAPNYAKARSELALAAGLGRKPAEKAEEPVLDAVEGPVVARRAGRPRKAA
ncbi:MucR family transcriptional regulator [Azospirillum doebereinerae]|uniref:MucR family transcriptional regulator n=1 Tax=Azospirillum doebereinerae TaxID=92933 RepID=UPI001EE5F835|nr:MucR family transcriptional regulator [Azospirillum doebereinerae]MCG5240945.1 MucR family transcriptional regulator [Azospirillum doebereinerae]